MSAFIHGSLALVGFGLGLGVALALGRRPDMDPLLAQLCGGAVVLGWWQIVQGASQWLARRRIAREVEAVRAQQERLGESLELVRAEMGGLTYTYESTARARTDRLVSEVQVLEGLIQQLRPGQTGPSGSESAANPETDRPSSIADNAAGVSSPPSIASTSGERFERAEDTTLSVIREAIEDNRVDLYLQPIVSLPQRRLRFYEGLTRLRESTGRIILPAEYLPVAERTGLMSVIDNLLLFRAVQVVRRLASRDRNVGLVCNISGHTLADKAFFAQFLDFMNTNRSLARQLVFEFGQSVLEHAGPAEMRGLADLAKLGFAFSLDKVTSLDLDPHYLRDRNFAYVKIPAPLLLGAGQGGAQRVASRDLKALLARQGLDLIVERIEDERTVIEVLDHDVDFGQGYLFGAPRPIRDTLLGDVA